MDFNLSVLWNTKHLILSGFFTTLLLAVVIIPIGTALGLGVAICMKSKNGFVKTLSSLFTNFIRAMPIFVMIIWVYYALPIIAGIKISAFETGVVVLSLHLCGYVAELIRSGIETIPKGQIEAAKSLGMNDFEILRRITLPQVFRQIASPLAGTYIEEIKNTPLLSVIALDELLHTGQVIISQTYRPLEIYTAIAIIFLVILLPIGFLGRKYEFTFMKKAEAAANE